MLCGCYGNRQEVGDYRWEIECTGCATALRIRLQHYLRATISKTTVPFWPTSNGEERSSWSGMFRDGANKKTEGWGNGKEKSRAKENNKGH